MDPVVGFGLLLYLHSEIMYTSFQILEVAMYFVLRFSVVVGYAGLE
jgi:hypothetical protein